MPPVYCVTTKATRTRIDNAFVRAYNAHVSAHANEENRHNVRTILNFKRWCLMYLSIFTLFDER